MTEKTVKITMTLGKESEVIPAGLFCDALETCVMSVYSAQSVAESGTLLPADLSPDAIVTVEGINDSKPYSKIHTIKVLREKIAQSTARMNAITAYDNAHGYSEPDEGITGQTPRKGKKSKVQDMGFLSAFVVKK
jgi:hypothetical protein